MARVRRKVSVNQAVKNIRASFGEGCFEVKADGSWRVIR